MCQWWARGIFSLTAPFMFAFNTRFDCPASCVCSGTQPSRQSIQTYQPSLDGRTHLPSCQNDHRRTTAAHHIQRVYTGNPRPQNGQFTFESIALLAFNSQRKSSEEAAGKIYLFYSSPSQEGVRYFSSQEEMTRIFPRPNVFSWPKRKGYKNS